MTRRLATEVPSTRQRLPVGTHLAWPRAALTSVLLAGAVPSCVSDPGYEAPIECESERTQCHTSCVDLESDRANCGSCDVACAQDATCVSGECVCGGGLVSCETGCADVSTDPVNCGACGNECAPDEVCSGARCAASCRTYETDCERACIDLTSNPTHCGACGETCGAGRTCVGGRCACAAGTENCAGDCVSISIDRENCGACGEVCVNGEVCSGGRCHCPGGTTACEGGCVELLSDASNCGACGKVCGDGEVCSSGHCATECGPRLTQCARSCVDQDASGRHCGECDAACDDAEICVGGVCQCPPGWELCGDRCVELQSDANNCGHCGYYCASGQSCNAGQCECPGGGALCGAACVAPEEHPGHCGECNRQCEQGDACSGGACAPSCSATESRCGSSCVDLSASDAHCGDCEQACDPNLVCSEGSCLCRSGAIRCDGVCVDPSTSASHCGACGSTCSSDELCIAGTCEAKRTECLDDCSLPWGITWGCQRRFMYGVNYAWETYSGDFGGIPTWGQPGVSGNVDAIDARMADMSAQGVDVVRWWVWPDFRGAGVEFDGADTPSGLGSTALVDLEKALELAFAHDLRLMLTLFSFDNFRASTMVGNREVPGMKPIATDDARRMALVDQVIRPFVRAAEQSPYRERLIAWDVINEPEWAMKGPSKYCDDDELPEQDGLEHLTHDEMETFVSDVIAGLRSESRALVTVGGASTLWACAWKAVDLDFYQFHIYDWIDEWKPYELSPAELGIVDKPAVMGEFPLDGLSRASYAELLEQWYDGGWSGALGWAVTDGAFDWDGSKAAVSSFSSERSCETHY